jgi:hypothetical protein
LRIIGAAPGITANVTIDRLALSALYAFLQNRPWIKPEEDTQQIVFDSVNPYAATSACAVSRIYEFPVDEVLTWLL